MNKRLTVIGSNVLLWLGMQVSVNADQQLIFDQTPPAIEQHFGQYWTRLTTRNSAGERVITYTYNPRSIRHLFSDTTEELRLAIVFVDDRAQSIEIPYGKWFFAQLTFGEKVYPTEFTDLFEAVFGYRPATETSVYGRVLYDDAGEGGTLHITEYCIDQGIAFFYEWASTRDYPILLRIYPEPRCSSS